MVASWDQALKRLFEEAPQDFVSWLLPGTTYLSSVSTEFPAQEHDERRADSLGHCEFSGQPVILHVEFQSSGDKKMARRLLEYNIKAEGKHGCPVISCVIYLRKDSNIVQPPLLSVQPDGELIYRFHFRAIMLWELSAGEMLARELPGVWALLPLSRDGKKMEVIEEMIRRLQEHGKLGVLSIGYLLAAKVWTSEHEQKWLRRRFEMLRDELRDNWAYQEILQEGEVIALRKTLLAFVEKRFPSLLRLAQSVSSTTDLAELQHLIWNVGLSPTFEEAQTALLASNKESKN